MSPRSTLMSSDPDEVLPMPRKKTKGPSMRAYFTNLFREHPEWLEGSNNKAVLEQWRKDHPRQQLTGRVKQSMANAKSDLRSKLREGTAVTAVVTGDTPLEKLEDSIDD